MSRPNSRKLISEINVVPYVDVMLVLLVIFMITAPLISQGIIVDLPDVPSDPVNAALDDPLNLSVDAQGRFYLNFGGDPEQPVDDQTVLDRTSALVRRNADVSIFVRGDEGATHGSVMNGFALLHKGGAKQAILVTESSETER
jgi:biopolymer transport protein TolR